MFYLTTHSIHFIYGYMASVKNHRDSERGNPLPPHGLLFPISSNGSFICTIPQTYILTYKHAYIRAYVHIYIHTYIHIYVRTYIHVCLCLLISVF